MIHPKRLFQPTLLAALLCGASFTGVRAQDAGGDRPRAPHEPPPSPLFDALDTNHDGTISADEIANASTALKALLKNGATEITRDDVRPPRPFAAREERERDEQAWARPQPGTESARPHHAPPADDPAADEDAPPRAREDGDRENRPFHRPPPRHGPEDGQTSDDHARRHPPAADEADRPPRPEDRPAGAAEERGRAPRPFRGNDAEHPHHRPAPPSPLFDALDTNHDGVISNDEIDKAPDALKKLDKSGSGQIKRDDLRPPAPPRDRE